MKNLNILFLLSMVLSVLFVKAAGSRALSISRLTDSARLKQAGVDTITARLKAAILAGGANAELAHTWMKTMQHNGSWSDVDYNDTSIVTWKPMKHLERLTAMAIAYHSVKNRFYHDPEIPVRIVNGLQYFIDRKPRSANWWFRDIGAQQGFMRPLLLLKGQINDSTLHSLSAFLRDQTANKAHRGKNRSWISETLIYKGCIENDFELVKRGFSSIASTLIIVKGLNDEGVKADFSFHQHHAQLQSGSYGLSILDDYARYLLLIRNTLFQDAFTNGQRRLLTNQLLLGNQWLSYRNVMDFGAYGRGIARSGGTDGIAPKTLELMARADSEHSAAYLSWKQNLAGGPSAITGNRFFWNSAIMTQHGLNYYLSAKIITNRTYGTEALNGENIKSYNLPLGATNILVTGTEYKDIFSVWDWSRIPGTTARQNDSLTALTGYQIGTNEFGGGVSDGENGLIAFEQNYHQVKAHKAYFFIGNRMICLGSGIESNTADKVLTSVNQTNSNGTIYYSNVGGTKSLTRDTLAGKDINWVYHNGVGYVFAPGQHISIENKIQSGSWRQINRAESDSILKKKIFSISIDHGKSPRGQTYAYVVIPGAKPQDMAKQYSNRLQILKNDTVAQAIYGKLSDQAMIVYYQPGKVTLPKGLTVSASQPALVMIGGKAGGYSISVSDPLYRQQQLRFAINKKLTGRGAVSKGKDTILTFDLPQEDHAGQPQTAWFVLNDSPFTHILTTRHNNIQK